MCLWCEVELRVYRAFAAQERKALSAIRRIEREPPPASGEVADRNRCLWEKKLEYVVARMQRERLAEEMRGAELCDEDAAARKPRTPRRFPEPRLPAHLVSTFERYVERVFDRLAGPPAHRPPRRRRGTLVPFTPPDDRAR